MGKFLVFLVAMVIGFVAAFGWSASDEIGAEVETRLAEDFVPQCVRRSGFPAEAKHFAPDICRCMQSEFASRNLAITDAFGAKRAEMQEITRACAAKFGLQPVG